MDSAFQDAHLTLVGRDQIVASAKEVLKDIQEIDVIYTSPLSRCIQSAYAIRELVPCSTIHVTDNLIERQGGKHICNKRMDAELLRVHYPDLDYRHMAASGPHYYGTNVAHESAAYMNYRKNGFKALIRPEHSKNTIVVVTHHDVLESWFGKSLPNAGTFEIPFAEFTKRT